MSGKMKWLLALVLAVSVVAVARASLQNQYYMPMAFREFTPTITPTSTMTPTNTPSVSPTATRTATPTRTQTPRPRIWLDDIQLNGPGGPLDEWVSVKNNTDDSEDFTDWTLRDEGGNIYTFPDGFRLGEDDSVKVWSKDGTNSSSNLYWDFVPDNEQEEENGVWNDHGDCAYLRDEDNDKVYGKCWEEDGTSYIPQDW
jgi:hypothetical protein